MSVLNQAVLKRFLKLAAERLSGEWVLLGGTVLPVLGEAYRSTTDIDFVPVGKVSNAETLKLMEICEELRLPVETVNAAAGHFLHKIADFKKHLVLLEQGKAKIYLPGVLLFIQLKLNRLSESDLSDCLAMLRIKRAELTTAEKKVLRRIVEKAKNGAAESKLQRLNKLAAEL